eukprot:jgi/Orpsp1_1/1181035/evm.model.c7180000075586.1
MNKNSHESYSYTKYINNFNEYLSKNNYNTSNVNKNSRIPLSSLCSNKSSRTKASSKIKSKIINENIHSFVDLNENSQIYSISSIINPT